MKKTIEDVLSRMVNWKFRRAFQYAESIKNFPKDALNMLRVLAEQFENCGWCDGHAFELIPNFNDAIAEKLGYIWSNEEDFWVKK